MLKHNLHCLRDDRKDVAHFRDGFTIFQPIRQNAQCQRFYLCNSVFLSLAIGHHSGDGRNLCHPTSVFFLVNFNNEILRHSFCLLCENRILAIQFSLH